MTTIDSPADRLISAAQPALAAELNQILEELRSRIESESEARMQRAVLEKDVEHKAELERLRQSLTAEAENAAQAQADEVRNRIEGELEARFSEQLETRLAALTQEKDSEAQAASESWNEQQMVLERELERWRTLAEYLNKLGESSSQLEILRRFLMSGSRFAASVAVYLQKTDGLSLWKSEGEGAAFPEVVSDESIDPEWFYSAVVVRGKTVAAVAATGATDREALVVMVAALKRAVENFGLRLRFMAGPSNETAGSREAASGAEGPAAAAPETTTVAGPAAEGPADNAPGDHRSGTIEMPTRTPTDGGAPDSDPRAMAREIVSEIKSNHEKQVLEGRVNADLYRRLQSPIDDGRSRFLGRVNGETDADYYHEEVVKILADNIVSRLGADYPGPR